MPTMASFPHPQTLQTLLDKAVALPHSRTLNTAALAGLYNGPLMLPLQRPAAIVGCLVASVDGTTAQNDQGGSVAIRGNSAEDRLILGMLRTAADLILIGGKTFCSYPRHQWTAERVLPHLTEDIAATRHQLGLAPIPPLAIVSASGTLPEHHAAWELPAAALCVVTTAAGATVLQHQNFPGTILVAAESGPLSTTAIQTALQQHFDPQLIVCEGGPTLLGQLLASNRLSELFVTVAPSITGRAATYRGMFESEAITTPAAASLLSVRYAEDYLFLRYGLHNH